MLSSLRPVFIKEKLASRRTLSSRRRGSYSSNGGQDGGDAGSAGVNSRDSTSIHSRKSRSRGDSFDHSNGDDDSVSSVMSVVDQDFLVECQRLGISKELALKALKQSRERNETWWNKTVPSSKKKKSIHRKVINKQHETESDDNVVIVKEAEAAVTTTIDEGEEKETTDHPEKQQQEEEEEDVVMKSIQTIFERRGSLVLEQAKEVALLGSKNRSIGKNLNQLDTEKDETPAKAADEGVVATTDKEDDDDSSLGDADANDPQQLTPEQQQEEYIANVAQLLKLAKKEVLSSLKETNGDTTSERFQSAVTALSAIYHGSGFHLSKVSERVPMEGTWKTISKPQYGSRSSEDKQNKVNSKGYYVYTLGRMSFDMFRPTDLICSIHDTIVKTRSLDLSEGKDQLPREIPKSLYNEVMAEAEQQQQQQNDVAIVTTPKTTNDDNNNNKVSSSSTTTNNSADPPPLLEEDDDDDDDEEETNNKSKETSESQDTTTTTDKNNHASAFTGDESSSSSSSPNNNNNNSNGESTTGSVILSKIRTYDIETHFIIEPRSYYEEQVEKIEQGKSSPIVTCVRAPSKPLKGCMTTYGYLLPDPNNLYRYTIWFTGGTVAPKLEPKKDETTMNGNSAGESSSTNNNGDSRRSSKEKRGGRRSSKEKESSPTTEESPSCTLPLHECKRKNKVCDVHGVHTILSRAERQKQQKLRDRYVRPKYGKYSHAGLTNSFLNLGGTLGSTLLPSLSSKLGEWEDLFAPDDTWRRSWSEQTKAFAAWVLLGADVPDKMEDDGSMNYTLRRPIGGHNTTYIDVLYLDETLRITRGNYGSYYVQTRSSHQLSSSSNKTSSSTNGSTSSNSHHHSSTSRKGNGRLKRHKS